MNRPLGRLRLLTEASAIILTKRRPPRIDAGGRRLSVVLWGNHSCVKGLP